MLNNYKGCLVGAILGDAFGMPSETNTARFSKEPSFSSA